jgi:hypothetical protein
MLGSQVSFIQAFFTATGVTIVNTAFFVVPGHFGVMESAHILIRRIRKLATIAVALLVFALSREKG